MYKNANFSTYIYRVLKQVHPDQGMSGDGLSTMNNLVRIVIFRVMASTNRVMVSTTNRKTIGSREIQTAVRLTLPGELSKHGVSEGTKAVTKYNAARTERSEQPKSDTKAKPVSRASLAGLTFPVTRIENIMKELANAERKSETAAVYLAAVLEYITAEVLELAGNAARDNKKIRVTPRHIKLAILNDSELGKLFQDVVLSGGVIPHIESALIKTKLAKAEGEEAPKRKVVKKTPTKGKAAVKKTSAKGKVGAKKVPAKGTKKVPAKK